MKRLGLAVGLLLMLSACVSKPVLLPNEKYNKVGHERSERDINICMKVADRQMQKTQHRRVLKGAATGAVVGGAVGLLGSNGNVGSAVVGSVIGGGIGTIAGATNKPEDIKRNMVNYCLNRKGYDVAGWD